MERYYQILEQLAEWFMQLFFDPAYHFVTEDKVQNIIIKKQQDVSEWWAKQKKQLLNARKRANSLPSESYSMAVLKQWLSVDYINSLVNFYRHHRWLQLIQ